MPNTASDDIREEITSLFVGDRTLGDSFAPPLLFVATNAVGSLGVAAAIAIAAGVLVALWRIRKGQQIVYALAGIAPLSIFFALGYGAADAWLEARGASWARALLYGWLGAFSAVLLLSYSG